MQKNLSNKNQRQQEENRTSGLEGHLIPSRLSEMRPTSSCSAVSSFAFVTSSVNVVCDYYITVLSVL